MLAQPRQVHHEGVFKLSVNFLLDALEIRILGPLGKFAAEDFLPVRAALDLFHALAGHQRARPRRRHRPGVRRGVKMLVVEGERLVVVVDLRQIGIGEDIGENAPFGAHARLELAVFLAQPAAIPALLVFPFLGIADAGLGLDIVEPGIFDAFARGPDILAGHRTGVAPDAFVEVEHHRDLRAYLHDTFSSARAGAGSSIQSVFACLRMMTNSSRLEPTVP